jgi:hypothetical protein
MKIVACCVLFMYFLSCDSRKGDKQDQASLPPTTFSSSITGLFDQLENKNPDDDELINSRIADTLIKYRAALFSMKDSVWNNDTSYYPLYITSSTDNNLCIMSWNTQMGGTMIEYASIAFFKTGQGVAYKRLTDVWMSGDTVNTFIHFDTTVTLQTANRTIYLSRGFGQGSSALKWEELRAFEISNGELIEPAIFPEFESGITYPDKFSTIRFINSVGIEFDLHHCTESFFEQRPVMLFLDKNSRLKIPKISDMGGNTDEYLSLVFNGKNFVQQ